MIKWSRKNCNLRNSKDTRCIIDLTNDEEDDDNEDDDEDEDNGDVYEATVDYPNDDDATIPCEDEEVDMDVE